MFGFIKKLIAGILSFLTGLIGGRKSSQYYLELKEDTTEESAPAPALQAAPASNGTKAAATAAPPATEKSPAPAPAKVEASKNGKNGKKATPKPDEPEKAPVANTTPPGETTFAPKYLSPSASSSNGRRRPGANMSSYLDMASQVKTPG